MAMRIVRSITSMRALAERWRRTGARVGLVPTMGALHAGHLALVAAARRASDRVVVSVFVNPSQFGPREDFSRYPRTPAADARLLRRAGVEALFMPAVAAMDPPGGATVVEVGGPLTRGLCAPFRPGHFRGVATVVARLFAIIRPHAAWFGRKDAQQAAVLGRMVRDLHFGIAVHTVPTVREPDGLARSSRNRLLTPAQRAAAPVLHEALALAAATVRGGARTRGAVLGPARRLLARIPGLRVQYLDLVDAATLAPVSRPAGRLLLAAAIHLGRTRLIDNRAVRAPR